MENAKPKALRAEKSWNADNRYQLKLIPMNVKNMAAMIGNLLKPGTTLSQRVARGGLWIFALQITIRLLGFVSTIILARILAPSDFGLFGIALMAMSALETFSQAGLGAALIQKEQDITPYLNTAWTVQVLRGVLLGLLLFITAPYVAAFFESHTAKPILQVIALSPLIRGFNNIGLVYFDKELQFHKNFAYWLTSSLANAIVAISAVLLLGNVWALIFGLLAGDIAQLTMSYIIHPYRPRPRFISGQFKELFNFGRWVFGSHIILYLVMQGDNILVGKLLGSSSLGFYRMAYQISSMPATEVTHVISQVTFPAYSKIQNDTHRLKEAFLKVFQITTFLSIPLVGLIFVFSSDFTRIFLGEKWQSMVPAMQILAFAGLLRSIEGTTGPVFVAIGKPVYDTLGQLLRLFILAIFIYSFTVNYGISGTSLSVVASFLVVTIYFIFIIIKVTGCRLIELSRLIFFPLISTLPAIVMIIIIETKFSIEIWGFFLLFLIFSLIYFVLIYLFNIFSNYKMWLFIKDQFNIFKSSLIL